MNKPEYLKSEGYKMLFTMAYGCRIGVHSEGFPIPPFGWDWVDDSARRPGSSSTYYRRWFGIRKMGRIKP